MSKQEKINNYNPNAPASSETNIFGLPFDANESSIIIVPLPWEVTVSFHAGTASAPMAVMNASRQVDLYDPYIKDAWKIGIFMEEESNDWASKSRELRGKAIRLITLITEGGSDEEVSQLDYLLHEINEACKLFNEQVKQHTLKLLNNNKIVIGLGGDHSTPLGIIEALCEKHSSFGILQLDAHCDLRNSYEGFTYSHASIMYNAIKNKQVEKLVQVGIRDYCEEEVNLINESDKIKAFFDRDIKRMKFNGKTIDDTYQLIVNELPQNIYLSFDIDALDPKLCPNTGTPVAGGFEADEVLYLIEKIVESGRVIIGMDINETANNSWDANESARLLYRLCNMVAKSNSLY